MSFLQFIKTRTFWKHFGLMLGITITVVVSVGFSLRWYTRFGEEIKVPDLNGKTLSQAEQVINSMHLRYQVIDSVYVEGMTPGIVVEQDPPIGGLVKEERTVYLTITKGNAPKVKLPNLIDMTLRQATQVLQNAGFLLGKVIPRTDLAINVILEMQTNGLPVHPGKSFTRGSAIDLVVGIMNADSLVTVPDLTGLSAEEARIMLYESSLNLGSVFYEGSISDTSAALVVRQRPVINPDELVNAASLVDIWLGDPQLIQDKNLIQPQY
jgi:beta-lactam-binding protein with PASTA domain